MLVIASCDNADESGAGAAASAGCVDGTLDASLEPVELEFGGTTRTYRLHVPPSYNGTTPMALVLNFHGWGSDAAGQQLFSAMDDTADANGFVVVYPEGTENGDDSLIRTGRSFNGGGPCCGTALNDNIDDVGFTRAIVEDLGTRGCLDTSRIYATGMSNGGYMAHRLACEASDLVAAVAPVAGVSGLDGADCAPGRGVSVMHFHGTGDTIAGYEGGGLVDAAGVVETHEAWIARNGCTGTPSVTFENGSAVCETVDQCRDGATVTLCTIAGMGHCWPGQLACGFEGVTEDIRANQAMWEFFETVTLRR